MSRSLNPAEGCVNCELCLPWQDNKGQTITRTNVVWGEGIEGSQIFLIGEAPGYYEDLLGRPFVGKSGKHLREELLPSAGLTQQDVYISNIVKCRPPNNRDPKPREVEACSEWLSKELNDVAPRLVVLMGRNAMRLGFPHAKKIGAITGAARACKIYDYPAIALATYHPAASIRDHNGRGRIAQQIISDLKRAKTLSERND